MAIDDIGALRQRIESLEEMSQRHAATIDDLHQLLFQISSDFRILNQAVSAAETGISRLDNQINVIGRAIANLLARVDRLEHPGGGPSDRS